MYVVAFAYLEKVNPAADADLFGLCLGYFRFWDALNQSKCVAAAGLVCSFRGVSDFALIKRACRITASTLAAAGHSQDVVSMLFTNRDILRRQHHAEQCKAVAQQLP